MFDDKAFEDDDDDTVWVAPICDARLVRCSGDINIGEEEEESRPGGREHPLAERSAAAAAADA